MQVEKEKKIYISIVLLLGYIVAFVLATADNNTNTDNKVKNSGEVSKYLEDLSTLTYKEKGNMYTLEGANENTVIDFDIDKKTLENINNLLIHIENLNDQQLTQNPKPEIKSDTAKIKEYITDIRKSFKSRREDIIKLLPVGKQMFDEIVTILAKLDNIKQKEVKLWEELQKIHKSQKSFMMYNTIDLKINVPKEDEQGKKNFDNFVKEIYNLKNLIEDLNNIVDKPNSYIALQKAVEELLKSGNEDGAKKAIHAFIKTIYLANYLTVMSNYYFTFKAFQDSFPEYNCRDVQLNIRKNMSDLEKTLHTVDRLPDNASDEMKRKQQQIHQIYNLKYLDSYVIFTNHGLMSYIYMPREEIRIAEIEKQIDNFYAVMLMNIQKIYMRQGQKENKKYNEKIINPLLYVLKDKHKELLRIGAEIFNKAGDNKEIEGKLDNYTIKVNNEEINISEISSSELLSKLQSYLTGAPQSSSSVFSTSIKFIGKPFTGIYSYISGIIASHWTKQLFSLIDDDKERSAITKLSNILDKINSVILELPNFIFTNMSDNEDFVSLDDLCKRNAGMHVSILMIEKIIQVRKAAGIPLPRISYLGEAAKAIESIIKENDKIIPMERKLNKPTITRNVFLLLDTNDSLKKDVFDFFINTAKEYKDAVKELPDIISNIDTRKKEAIYLSVDTLTALLNKGSNTMVSRYALADIKKQYQNFNEYGNLLYNIIRNSKSPLKRRSLASTKEIDSIIKFMNLINIYKNLSLEDEGSTNTTGHLKNLLTQIDTFLNDQDVQSAMKKDVNDLYIKNIKMEDIEDKYILHLDNALGYPLELAHKIDPINYSSPIKIIESIYTSLLEKENTIKTPFASFKKTVSNAITSSDKTLESSSGYMNIIFWVGILLIAGSAIGGGAYYYFVYKKNSAAA